MRVFRKLKCFLDAVSRGSLLFINICRKNLHFQKISIDKEHMFGYNIKEQMFGDKSKNSMSFRRR